MCFLQSNHISPELLQDSSFIGLGPLASKSCNVEGPYLDGSSSYYALEGPPLVGPLGTAAAEEEEVALGPDTLLPLLEEGALGDLTANGLEAFVRIFLSLSLCLLTGGAD